MSSTHPFLLCLYPAIYVLSKLNIFKINLPVILESSISYFYLPFFLIVLFVIFLYRYVAPEILRGDRYGVEVRTLQHCYHYMVSSRCMQHITSLTTHTHTHAHTYIYMYSYSLSPTLSLTRSPPPYLPPSHTRTQNTTVQHTRPLPPSPPPHPHTQQVDIWSMGVICYVLLAGYPPFYDEDQKKLFRKIKDGKYHFHQDYWCNISPDAIDMIKRMLCVSQQDR